MSQQETVLRQLLTLLWDNYKQRVSYARTYCELVEAKGGRIVNDHIALRTFNCATGTQPAGVTALERIFTALGYRKAEEYIFTKKQLTAWHYEHSDVLLPKIFISQLEVAALPKDAQDIINDAVSNTQDPMSDESKQALAQLERGEDVTSDLTALAKQLAECFTRPWATPKRATIEAANEASQYSAWTLLHGNSVNHFTAYINKQQVAEWTNIEQTVAGLAEAGTPMKDNIEGEPGSILRQSSTQAVREACDVIEADGSAGKIDWSYAYYELAERGPIHDEQGDSKEFSGFLGEQATHLFDMTTMKKNA